MGAWVWGVRSLALKSILQASISTRSVLTLSTLMVLMTVVATTAVLIDLRQRELTHAQGETASLSRVLAEQTTRTFDGATLMMKGTRERLLDEFGRQLQLGSLPVRLLLQVRISGLPQVKSIFVVNRDGFVVNSSRPDFIPKLNVANRQFFKHFTDGAQDESFITRPEKAQVDDQWTYYVSTRLIDHTGTFRGVLVASISIDYFESLYTSIGLDSVNRIQLLNSEGRLLASIPHDETRFGQVAEHPALIAELSAKKQGEAMISKDLRENLQFVAYHQVAKYPLIISAATDEYEALAPWRRTVRPILAGITLLIIFVLTTTFFMLKNLLRREALEFALKESDEQLRQMVQTSPNAIVTVDAEQRFVLFNGAAEKLFGVSASNAIGHTLGEWLSRCGNQPQCRVLHHHLQDGLHSPTGTVASGIVELGGDAHKLPAELSLSTTTVHGQLLVTATFRDLTDSQRAEQELLASNRQLQELSSSLESVREEERVRIARELHDELGQLLTGIRMEVSWLGGRLTADQQALVDKIKNIKGQIDQTIGSVRRISSELRPLILDDLGFIAAAGWYADQFSARTGIAVTLHLPATDPWQDNNVATALFRILQESLTNVARHAQAHKVDIRLELNGNEWTLSIQDDGIGFTQNPARRSGIGLIGMRERAHILGGRFSVMSSYVKGTLVETVIPAQKKKEEENGTLQSIAGG